MNYVSIDLETTGLIPGKHKIIEFGAIIHWDGVPIEQLPRFRRVIRQEDAVWTLYCIGMHRDWYFDLKTLVMAPTCDYDGCIVDNDSNVLVEFMTWLQKHGYKGKILPAGKNVAGFDIQFIKQLYGYTARDWYHRVLDPAMFYLLPTDTVPPDLRTCMIRAGLDYDEKLAHTALYDAECVVSLLRHGMPK